MNIEQQKALALAAARLRLQAGPEPGMSATDVPWYENVAAGAGKAISDMGLGIRQLVGNASQEEVDARKAQDAPLMNTGAGFTGNILGNVAAAVTPGLGMAGTGAALGKGGLQAAGKYLLASPSTLGGLATQGGLGATQGLIQPTATGESRTINTAVGGAAGGIIPALGIALRGGKAAVEPLYEGGREQILSRALRNATGPNADAVAQRLATPQIHVPGSMPTAAEVGESGGLAAMQRAAAATDPEAYATRAAQQNEARVTQLRDLAGSAGERDFHAASRSASAEQLYDEAYKAGVDIRRNPVTGQFRSAAEIAGTKGEITKLLKRPAVQEAVEEARKLAANEGVKMTDLAGSVKGLDYVKRAIDDKIKATQGNEQRVLVDLKNRLLTTIDGLSPKYAEARKTFTEMSKPINQMDIAETIAGKSINPLTEILQPQAFARALSDDTAKSATGFNKATLSGVLEPDQLGKLEGIKQDLARAVAARDMGRGAGSDTVQKLAMTNLLQRSGIPEGAINFYGMGTVGKALYSNADDTMKQRLAQALLNPQEASKLMQRAAPNPQMDKLIEALRMSANPLLIGGAQGRLNAPQ